ncbi:hypothetical protein CryarDRAFT_0257 [Cryptosporangium arvum DSM 44712]|uniref:ABC-type Mn/Zn transport systems, ATPase component n=2 Tax=Cryptosporangium TaxID=65502 RepID=A0A010YVS0_9ACTN|nr:hypothetical protein CryarDRAFT_0257 [Cryptosporangium arvum DSM 44712]
MESRNTVIRSMHDVGLASWFGGSLMGAIGVNGAANEVGDEKDRVRVAAAGWARWSPIAAASIGTHLVGGLGLVVANRGRVAGQAGVTANTVAKTAITVAAVAATVYSGVLGARVATAGKVPAEGSVVPGEQTPEDVAATQRQLRVVQWVIPALTGVLVVLGAQQGEQQKPNQRLIGAAKRSARTARRLANR